MLAIIKKGLVEPGLLGNKTCPVPCLDVRICVGSAFKAGKRCAAAAGHRMSPPSMPTSHQHYFISPKTVLRTWVPDEDVDSTLYIATSLWYADGIEAFISNQSEAASQAQVSALAEAVMAKAKLSVLSSSGTKLIVSPLGPVAAQFWVCEKVSSCFKGQRIVVGPMMGAPKSSGGAPTIKLNATEEHQWVFTEFDPSDSATKKQVKGSAFMPAQLAMMPVGRGSSR